MKYKLYIIYNAREIDWFILWVKELSPDMSEVWTMGGGGMWPLLAQVPNTTTAPVCNLFHGGH